MRLVSALLLFGLVSCDAPGPITIDPGTQVLVIGDSVMEWNREDDAAIADVIAEETGLAVFNAGVSGARLSAEDPDDAEAGFDIRQQYQPGEWEWVVMDGGANDLGDECGCGPCGPTLDEMVSEDGDAGQYPAFARTVTDNGSRLLVMGYYAPPEGGEADFTACAEEFVEFNRRLQSMALATEDVYFASAADVIDPSNPGHYDEDRVHPSVEGSRLIGELLSTVITANSMD
ncbi:MAG: SGNH/GDSL hydrolase family protein [Bacteroidota bacterium]